MRHKHMLDEATDAFSKVTYATPALEGAPWLARAALPDASSDSLALSALAWAARSFVRHRWLTR